MYATRMTELHRGSIGVSLPRMRLVIPIVASACVLVACSSGGRAPAEPAQPIASAPVPPASSAVPSPITAAGPDAASPSPASSALIEDASAPVATKPAPVERSGKTWPFHAWDRAEAFTFNRFPMRSGAPFRIYDDNGWSPHVADKKPLDTALAKQSVDLVLAGKSELEMTKCPFPRHAVVLYDHDVPIASINVCFSCGDVLLWPKWGPPERDWNALTDAQTKKALADLEAESARKKKLFAQVFPKWKTFFGDAVGFPIDEKWH